MYDGTASSGSDTKHMITRYFFKNAQPLTKDTSGIVRQLIRSGGAVAWLAVGV
jgi:hypothetical protein